MNAQIRLPAPMRLCSVPSTTLLLTVLFPPPHFTLVSQVQEFMEALQKMDSEVLPQPHAYGGSEALSESSIYCIMKVYVFTRIRKTTEIQSQSIFEREYVCARQRDRHWQYELSGRDGQIHTAKNLISESSCLSLRRSLPSSPPLLPPSKDPLFRMPANVEDRSKEGASL
jgi:hypothetical protein